MHARATMSEKTGIIYWQSRYEIPRHISRVELDGAVLVRPSHRARLCDTSATLPDRARPSERERARERAREREERESERDPAQSRGVVSEVQCVRLKAVLVEVTAGWAQPILIACPVSYRT